ncbi:prepilin-type N-terminal cleavage/methylation domain-containing protein [uncultured Tateyamaria sp.]|uniref:prepilin-type N-terminal cleavage/methylation domain-containing protein n=1 Tax=uncultured Tateyamaria sp. TaxID=455651 RepID=UPI002618A6E2|nr:prepilin-type N-terminal cleavage/methylation domain-containing protein [uncultured Tateyamaria sp.]
MIQPRGRDTGVTLVEMLVVLTVFAVVAGAAALSFPNTRRANTTEAEARAWAARLDRAVSVALITNAGFGIRHDGTAIGFVERGDDRQWRPHSDPELAKVKLSGRGSRISINAQEVFSVSANLIPESSTPFRAMFGSGTDTWVVTLDGTRVRVAEGSFP